MDERTNGPRRRPANGVQRLLLVLALLAAGLLLILPLTMIFAQVAAGGWALLIENLSADYLHHAFGLTLLTTLVTIPVNLAFGLAFAWCITHYRFRGRRLMLALIDIPYATSPVVAAKFAATALRFRTMALISGPLVPAIWAKAPVSSRMFAVMSRTLTAVSTSECCNSLLPKTLFMEDTMPCTSSTSLFMLAMIESTFCSPTP